MITALVIGFILGASLVATPLIIQLFSQYKIGEQVDNIDDILEDTIDDLNDERLGENEYKISVTPPAELENQIVSHSEKEIKKQHIITVNENVLVNKVYVKPDEWQIVFEKES